MKRVETLGQFEQLVLVAVRNIRDAYSVPIQAKVQSMYPKPVSLPAVYMALDRLEEKGYVRARRGDPVPERDKPRRYYSIRPAGEKALEDSAASLQLFLEELRAEPELPFADLQTQE